MKDNKQLIRSIALLMTFSLVSIIFIKISISYFWIGLYPEKDYEILENEAHNNIFLKDGSINLEHLSDNSIKAKLVQKNESNGIIELRKGHAELELKYTNSELAVSVEIVREHTKAEFNAVSVGLLIIYILVSLIVSFILIRTGLILIMKIETSLNG